MRHHEYREQFQLPRFIEGDHMSATAMTTLVVVVVDKDQRRHGTHISPCGPNALQMPETVNIFADAEAVLELGHASDARVLAGRDWLAALVDHFLRDERAASGTKRG